VDESRVLIDLRGRGLIQANKRTYVAALIDLKQWHSGSPYI
jgi:hypothetical protein